MIGESIKVLDHGFVELIDCMGDDSSIVQAARVSFAKDGEVRPPADDIGLIRYLMRHWHTTPFEMVEFKFHMKLPIVVARQMIRHRTANVNEVSGRYSELPEEFYVPPADRIRLQSTTNKQGSSEEVVHQAQVQSDIFREEAADNFSVYKARLEAGMAKELARNNLPLSTYTRWYWKCDLHNLLHFLRLRLDSHAQEEIRVYAEAMAKFVKWRCPIAWAAFEDYRLNAMTLSRLEVETLQHLFASYESNKTFGGCEIKNKREAEEWSAKLARLRALCTGGQR